MRIESVAYGRVGVVYGAHSKEDVAGLDVERVVQRQRVVTAAISQILEVVCAFLAE